MSFPKLKGLRVSCLWPALSHIAEKRNLDIHYKKDLYKALLILNSEIQIHNG